MNFSDTYFSKFPDEFQKHLYLLFKYAAPRDKLLLFTKFKYGDDITFKEISEKMHYATARKAYSNYLDFARSGVIQDLGGKNG